MHVVLYSHLELQVNVFIDLLFLILFLMKLAMEIHSSEEIIGDSGRVFKQ